MTFVVFALDTSAPFTIVNLCEFLLYRCEWLDFANVENLLKMIMVAKMQMS